MRRRLLLSFAVIALAAIASMFWLVRQSAVGEVRTFMRRGGMMGLEQVASDLEDYYQQSGNWRGAEEVLAGFRGGHGMMGGQGHGMMSGGPRLILADAAANILADTAGENNAARLTQSERDNAILLQDARSQTIGYLVAEGMVVEDPLAEQALLDRLVRAVLIAAAVSGVLALVLAWLFSARLLKPVQELTQAARGMAAGDLGRRVAVHGNDEIAALGDTFNQMADSLQRAEQARRAMTADIAHELRTPIAVQRAHLEALQDGIYPLTPENLQPVLESTGLLARLVEDLRTLALADAGELKLVKSPTSLGDLVSRVVERFRPEAEARQVHLVFQPGVPVSLSVDALRVEQILNNLLSNAIRHTPERGQVQISQAIQSGWVETVVADTGSGIEPEDLPRVFERFYRADKSRSRQEGGTGLGLAIARQLALAHGGDLTAGNRESGKGGAVFVLRLRQE